MASSDKSCCPNIERCELFGRLRTEAALSFCLESYCHGDFTRCARYRFVKAEGRRPPSDLLPTGAKLLST